MQQNPASKGENRWEYSMGLTRGDLVALATVTIALVVVVVGLVYVARALNRLERMVQRVNDGLDIVLVKMARKEEVPMWSTLKASVEPIAEEVGTIPAAADVPPPVASSRKSNVQVYEDILREHGTLPLSEIVRLAQELGVVIKGEGKPSKTVRSALSGSKRFVNHGDNHWSLAQTAEVVE